MGMMSDAMKSSKRTRRDMLNELQAENNSLKRQLEAPGAVKLPTDLILALRGMAEERGLTVETFCEVRLRAIYHAYTFRKVLRLNDWMPFGQYKHTRVEDMIRADPRYVNFLASESTIFVLDEAATQLLKELS